MRMEECETTILLSGLKLLFHCSDLLFFYEVSREPVNYVHILYIAFGKWLGKGACPNYFWKN